MNLIYNNSNNPKNKLIDFDIKFTNNINEVKKILNYDININENTNKDLNNLNEKEILDNICYFLADEFQLCTFSKLNKIKKYFNNTNLKKPYSEWIYNIKNQLIPVPMGINQESIDYNFNSLYELNEYLPLNKNIMIIKPISQNNIKNDTLYLYQNIEPHMIINNKCKTLSIFTLIDTINKSKQEFKYDKIYDNNLKKYKILNLNQNINDNNNDIEEQDFIYIKYLLIDKIDKSEKKGELYSIQIFLQQLFYSLNFLKEDGELLLDISLISLYLPNIQIIYYLTTIFKEMRFIKSELYKNEPFSGFMIFNGFKKNNYKKNDINKILKSLNNNENKNNNDNKYIQTLYKEDISKEFKKYLNNVFKKVFKENEEYEKKKEFLKNELLNKPYSFRKFLDFIIEKSVDYCSKNQIPINNIYIKYYEKKIPDNLKFKYFPKDKNVDLKKIKMTTESLYSVTFPKEADQISNIIKKYFPNCKTIVDTSANVGGNSLSFSKNFEKVISIEIDPETKDALTNNINLYKRNNVEIILGDYTKLKEELNGDVYFFDPPWGGVYYKIKENMDLYLSEIDIIDLLPKNFVLKAPLNYNIQKVVQKYKNIQIYFLVNFIILIPNYNISELELIDKGYYY